MTLFGLVELSQTPKRAVRGLVLSVFACPRACALPGTAERIAKTKTPPAMKRLLTRIEVPLSNGLVNPVSIVYRRLFAKQAPTKSVKKGRASADLAKALTRNRGQIAARVVFRRAVAIDVRRRRFMSLAQASLSKTFHDVFEIVGRRVPLLQFNAGREVRLDFKNSGQGLAGIAAAQLPL